MIIHSIRLRLQLWLAFMLACILCGFGFTAYQLQRNTRLGQIDEQLERRVAALNSDARGGIPPMNFFPFGGPDGDRRNRGGPGMEPTNRLMSNPGMEGPRRFGGPPPHEPNDFNFDARKIQLSATTQSLFGSITTNDYYYAIGSRSGVALSKATNAPGDLAFPRAQNADSRIHTRTIGERREALQFTEIGECILVGRVISADLQAMSHFAGWLCAAGGGILALGLSGGWWLATRAIRPLEEISAAASRISAGNLTERINVTETDSELGRLAGVLNSTFARLERAFAQQKQFTADASHELRTPIAVLISEAQATLARERSADEYRETVRACLDTAQQMRQLAQSLLELARFDAGQETITREPMDLAERAQTCIEHIRPLANDRAVVIHLDLAPALTTGDPVWLGQVLTNLLTNAVHYNRHGGEIRVTTRRDNGAVQLTVADTGVGIKTEDLPHIFERFFRGDKSRTAANGRAGLGLAICKAILDSQGGSIVADSKPGEGSSFVVTMPAR